ncbi:hypothetical protein M6B38_233735 [Iris pallida]|uniref:NADH dehydrogenase subunit 4L n=1 Tax=Iris pallida TaxID=29817 RepID=A0AAX6DQK8_IRIPA|nr:hypothetical protein M6B38_233735 [Iris pallida]
MVCWVGCLFVSERACVLFVLVGIRALSMSVVGLLAILIPSCGRSCMQSSCPCP